ncbi:DUF2306 domain-containing protein [Chitinophaga filiformis]|uniref:DUF2306 domain-containing protein n=1 Tax=Chitinophaga filiformis TaxID=104663 RepID=A0A1G8CSM3_CHIFI|nr:hypothetical protein [Chitinophaga filiformis]SDH47950.1 hypothetical protein SAMN04488121_11312 [Chitinophaga filiformis]
METIHHINIAIHVSAGILAMLCGLAAAILNKRVKTHRILGRYFMWMMIFVIITGLAGVFVFKRNTFLLVITLLSGYNCFSGIRTMRLAGEKPVFIDYLAPVMVMAAAAYYLYYVYAMGLYWAPVVIYSTIGSLFLVTIYDLCRVIMPANARKKAMLYEHVYKMLSALSALASAFTGTVLPQFKPYSQFLPSMAGLTCIIVIFIRLGNRSLFFKSTKVLQAD